MEELGEVGFVERFRESGVGKADGLQVREGHVMGDGGCGLDDEFGGVRGKEVDA